jgi:hypothetical protein
MAAAFLGALSVGSALVSKIPEVIDLGKKVVSLMQDVRKNTNPTNIISPETQSQIAHVNETLVLMQKIQGLTPLTPSTPTTVDDITSWIKQGKGIQLDFQAWVDTNISIPFTAVRSSDPDIGSNTTGNFSDDTVKLNIAALNEAAKTDPGLAANADLLGQSLITAKQFIPFSASETVEDLAAMEQVTPAKVNVSSVTEVWNNILNEAFPLMSPSSAIAPVGAIVPCEISGIWLFDRSTVGETLYAFVDSTLATYSATFSFLAGGWGGVDISGGPLEFHTNATAQPYLRSTDVTTLYMPTTSTGLFITDQRYITADGVDQALPPKSTIYDWVSRWRLNISIDWSKVPQTKLWFTWLAHRWEDGSYSGETLIRTAFMNATTAFSNFSLEMDCDFVRQSSRYHHQIIVQGDVDTVFTASNAIFMFPSSTQIRGAIRPSKSLKAADITYRKEGQEFFSSLVDGSETYLSFFGTLANERSDDPVASVIALWAARVCNVASKINTALLFMPIAYGLLSPPIDIDNKYKIITGNAGASLVDFSKIQDWPLADGPFAGLSQDVKLKVINAIIQDLKSLGDAIMNNSVISSAFSSVARLG